MAELLSLPLSSSENESIVSFMNMFHLSWEECDMLELKIINTLNGHENESMMRLLMEQKSDTTTMEESIENATETVDEMMLWSAHHERALEEMRRGVEKIEWKNHKLDVMERNGRKLKETLKEILEKTNTTINTNKQIEELLDETDFNKNMKTVLNAAKTLEKQLQTQIDDDMKETRIGRETQQNIENIRKKFAQKGQKYIDELFMTSAQTCEMEREKIQNHTAYEQMKQTKEVLKYLVKIDHQALETLQKKYSTVFAQVYNGKMKTFFAQLMQNMPKGKNDARFSELNEYDPKNNRMMPIQKRYDARLRMMENQSPIMVETKSACTVFEWALFHVIPACEEEEKWIIDYFGSPIGSYPAEKFNKMMCSLFVNVEDNMKELVSIGSRVDQISNLSMLVMCEELLEQTQSAFVRSMLNNVKMHTMILWNSFVDGEVKWIEGLHLPAKQSGVLPPFMKFPSLVQRIQSAANSQSQTIDKSYQKITSTMFSWLNYIASQNQKYHDIVLLENIQWFYRVFISWPTSIPALVPILKKCETEYEHYANKYVQWSIDYEMPVVAKFWQTLRDQLYTTRPEDVQFSKGLSKHDLRNITHVHITPKQMQKHCMEMHKRLMKHLPRNMDLAKELWKRIENTLLEKLAWFETIVAQCYSDEKLVVSQDDIRTFFRAFHSS